MPILIRVVLFLAVLHFTSLSQDNAILNTEFYRSWLRYEFYQDINSGKSPRESMKMQQIMQVHFFKGKDSLLIGSFNEGMDLEFSVISPDTVFVYEQFRKDNVEFIIYLHDYDNETRLIVDDGNEKMFFKGLEGRYNRRDGVVRFINDRLITGEYFSAEDSSLKVTFFTNGKVAGLKNYGEYWIPTIPWEHPKDFDTIILLYISNGIRETDVYHKKKINNHLILYNTGKPPVHNPNVFPGSDSIILDKFVELIKINSGNLDIEEVESLKSR